ncbi:MAG: NfeD family protein [bacterium]|nr:NfeD family protein [bacterium]
MLEGIDWGIVLWLLAGVLSGVGELLTGTMFLLPFAVGAFAAAGAAALGANLAVVVGIFLVVTVATLAWAVRYAKKVDAQPPATREGANRYVGAVGAVTKEIVGRNPGQVRIGAETWRALSSSGESISLGTNIRVVEIRGNALVVDPR